MVSINIHFRPSRRGKEYEGRLFVRMISCRRSASFTLPYRLFPWEWDPGKSRVVTEHAPEARRAYLLSVVNNLTHELQLLQELRNEMPREDEQTVHRLLTAFRMRRQDGEISRMVVNLSEDLKAGGKYRTARAYGTVLRRWLRFIQEQGETSREITRSRLRAFEGTLKAEGLSLNTISFYIRNIRAIYNKCLANGWLIEKERDLFRGLFVSVAPSPKRSLSARQMQRIEELGKNPTSLSRQEQEALLLFQFSFYGRGISFVDMAYLKTTDVKEGVIYYKRRKTGTPMQVKISPEMKKILDYFRKNNENIPYLFPLINPQSNSHYHSYCRALQRQNERLNRIAKKTGMPGKLTTHIARHTWATIAKRENIPIAVISESLGHTSLKTTAIYLDSFESRVINEAARKVVKAVLKSAG
ncbi:MAG: site-specific integrase [Tannerellaceae bacterium]|nr:site-specific integrase [Tannerellaceae bacterium]